MTRTAKLLLKKNLITPEQYEKAYLEYMENGGTMGYHLVSQGAIDDHTLLSFLQTHYNIPPADTGALETIPAAVLDLLPSEVSRKFRLLPLSRDGSHLYLGITDPGDERALTDARRLTAMTILPVLLSETEMNAALHRYMASADDAVSSGDTFPYLLTDSFSGLWNPAPEDRAGGDSAAVSWGNTIEDALFAAMASTLPAEATPLPSTIEQPDPPPETTKPVPARETADSLKSSQQFTTLRMVSTHALGSPAAAMRPQKNRGVNAAGDDDLDDRWSSAPPSHVSSNTRSSIPASSARRISLFPPPGRQSRSSVPPPLGSRTRTDAQILHALETTASRDEILMLALEYMLRFADRAAFLVIRKSEIRGFHIAGDHTSREAIRAFWIPLTARSTLSQVAHSGQMHMGPIGDKPADAIFCAALGGTRGTSILLPISGGNRTVGILFADGILTHEIAWPRLTRLRETVTTSLARLLLRTHTRKTDNIRGE